MKREIGCGYKTPASPHVEGSTHRDGKENSAENEILGVAKDIYGLGRPGFR
jgi:hypothetical protein